MRIEVNRLEFLKRIKIADQIIKDNKIKPILSNIYAKVDRNELKFYGTDLDTTIVTFMNIDSLNEEGEFTFSFSLVDEYLKEIKDENITIRTEKEILFIETKDSSSEFLMVNPKDFPNNIDNFKLNDTTKKIELESKELIDIIQKVSFAADVTQNNIAMNCVRIESVAKHLYFIAAETYRLAYLSKYINKDIDNFEVSIPLNAIFALSKILSSLPPDNVKIYQNDNKIYFAVENIIISTRQVELKYPNYQNILSNTTYDKSLKINADTFNKILKRAMVFVRNNSESKYGTTFTFSDNKMNVHGISDVAKINEDIPVEYTGDSLKISLNIKFLTDFLQNISKDDNVIVEMYKNDSAVKMFRENDDNYLYIVMPLTLRD